MIGRALRAYPVERQTLRRTFVEDDNGFKVNTEASVAARAIERSSRPRPPPFCNDIRLHFEIPMQNSVPHTLPCVGSRCDRRHRRPSLRLASQEAVRICPTTVDLWCGKQAGHAAR